MSAVTYHPHSGRPVALSKRHLVPGTLGHRLIKKPRAGYCSVFRVTFESGAHRFATCDHQFSDLQWGTTDHGPVAKIEEVRFACAGKHVRVHFVSEQTTHGIRMRMCPNWSGNIIHSLILGVLDIPVRGATLKIVHAGQQETKIAPTALCPQIDWSHTTFRCWVLCKHAQLITRCVACCR